MTSSDKLCAWIVCTLITVAGLTAVGLTNLYNQRLLAAFQNGYEEGSIMGENTAHWIKAAAPAREGEG